MSAYKTSNYQDPKRHGLLPTPPNYLTSQPPKTIGLLPTPTNFQYSGLNQSIRQNFPQTKRKNWCKYKFVKWSHHPRQQPKSALEPPAKTPGLIENPPLMRGTYQCRICDREKRAMLRHNPDILLDGDSFITCFMCSEPLGWVYYCPYCAQRNR